MKKANEENNFLYLLAGMLGLICVIPIIDKLSEGQSAYILLLLFLSGVLLIESWTFKIEEKWFRTGIKMAVIAFLISIAAAITGSTPLGYLCLLAHIAFYCLAILISSNEVFLANKVTFNRIIGAV
ncbi:MAG: hypothetical protein ACR2PH_10980 [Desulfobulbia bacterium]